MKKKMTQFARAHPFALVGLCVGLLVSVLLLTLGFWGTLLMALLCGVGLWLGMSKDRGNGVAETLLKAFRGIKSLFTALINKR